MKIFDEKILEQYITIGVLRLPDFQEKIEGICNPDFDFTDEANRLIYKTVKEIRTVSQELPTVEMVIAATPERMRKSVYEHIESWKELNFDPKQYETLLLDQSVRFFKLSAIKQSIHDTVDAIEDGSGTKDLGERFEKAYKELTDKLSRATSYEEDQDEEYEYFESSPKRIERMIEEDELRIPTGFPTIDEIINGGLTPDSLSIIVGSIHGFKSGIMANMITRLALKGKNSLLFTLEMSKKEFARRFDAIFTSLDLNKLYKNPAVRKRFIRSFGELKKVEQLGRIYMKEFPTGVTTVADFKRHIKSKLDKGIKFDVIFCDYINLMKASASGETMYEDKKRIAEELRDLSKEFGIPVVSVTQVNKEGHATDLPEVDLYHTSESSGVPATADFQMIIGHSKEHREYEHEIHLKIVKNRLGGRIGEVIKLYYDAVSLKLYDASEQEEWMRESVISGDTRNLVARDVEDTTPTKPKKRGRK